MRLAYFDNLTLRYAQMDAGTFVFDDAADSRLMDGIRDPLVIPEMARLTWLAYLDRYSDVTGVTADFEAQRPVYTAVPFFKDGDSFVDGLCGVRLPSGFFSEADGR
jgi:hypothetical protein